MNNNSQQSYNNQQQGAVEPLHDTILYTQVRRDATALHNCKAVISNTGKILANTQNTKRITIVKEMIDTWYVLSRTLINTASIGRLKPEFCQALYNLIDAGTKKFNNRSINKSFEDVQAKLDKTQKVTSSEPIVAPDDFLDRLLQRAEEQANDFAQVSSSKVDPINLPSFSNSNRSSDPIYTEAQRIELAELTISNKKLALQMKKIKMRSFETESELKLAKLQNEINALKTKSVYDMMKAKESHVAALAQEVKLTENLTKAAQEQEKLDEQPKFFEVETITHERDDEGYRFENVSTEVIERKRDIHRERLNNSKMNLLNKINSGKLMPVIDEEEYIPKRKQFTRQIEAGQVLALENKNRLDDDNMSIASSSSNFTRKSNNSRYTNKPRFNKPKSQYSGPSQKSQRSVKSDLTDEDGFLI